MWLVTALPFYEACSAPSRASRQNGATFESGIPWRRFRGHAANIVFLIEDWPQGDGYFKASLKLKTAWLPDILDQSWFLIESGGNNEESP